MDPLMDFEAAIIEATRRVRAHEFAKFLETYCAPRPKMHADRKWLEGYCSFTTDTLPYITSHKHIVVHMIGAIIKTHEVAPRRLHSTTNGWTDALLDSLGC